MELLVLGEKKFNKHQYNERKTVKAVIIDNKKNRILLLNNMLIGGGVEQGESDEEALSRESIEEVGVKIKILNFLGKVIQYRNKTKKKYNINCYLAEYLFTERLPTTSDTLEINAVKKWTTTEAAISVLNSEIERLLKEDFEIGNTNSWEARIYNRQTALFFLSLVKRKYLP